MRQLLRVVADSLSGIASVAILCIFSAMALFADIIANDHALVAKTSDGIILPTRSNQDTQLYLWSIEPIIRYKPSTLGLSHTPYLPPDMSGQPKHYMGTDHIGRDVAAGVVHGSRWALLIGIGAILITVVIGLFFGILSGYYGDSSIRVSWILLTAWCFLQIIIVFYLTYSGLTSTTCLLLGCIAFIFTFWVICIKMTRVLALREWLVFSIVLLPLDLIVQRLHELWKAIPALFILLSILALIARPSVWSLIFTIAFLSWPSISRLVRAELLRIREMNYIKAASIGGISHLNIILKYALPNAIAPLFVLVSFGISGAIIVESTLSFLGIGLSADQVTWGSLMGAARNNYRAWWLAVFPGVCIFLLVFAFNTIGENLREHYGRMM